MVTRLSKRSLFLLGSLLVFSLLPLAFHDNRFMMNMLILGFIWSVVATAWDLIMGYARVLSFGQIVFFALGGYTTAMLTLHLGIPPGLGILAGGGVAAGIGLLIALPCLRLRGIYVAIVTFAVHLVLPTLLILGGPIGTGGGWGLVGIPSLSVGQYTFTRLELVPWYYITLGISASLLFAIYKIINSSLGLAFVALRDAEPFAKNLGINEYRHTLIAFGISAFVTGLIGAFYVHYMGAISPAIFGLDYFLFALIMVMLGGMARFPGPVIGAFVVIFVNYSLLPLGAFRLVILGTIVIAVMLALPQGLAGIPEAINRLRGRRAFKKMTPLPETKQEV